MYYTYESNNSEFLTQKATPRITDRGCWRDTNRDLGVDVDVDQDRQRQRLGSGIDVDQGQEET